MNKRISSNNESEVRKGPWTLEEDIILTNYITEHGERNWNSLASCAGLKRTGKSCRLRWLNYLKPDVRRGNITMEEQSLITELHAKWGNRWSKIASQLPGRTDNEIKNYFRTKIQKTIKQHDYLDQYSSHLPKRINKEINTSSKGFDHEEILEQTNFPLHFNGVTQADIPNWNTCDLREKLWSMDDYLSMESWNGNSSYSLADKYV